jgi:hypothetical protein
MAKRRVARTRRPDHKEDNKLRAIYAKSRREFSAADLQKFTVVEQGIPLKKVIAEMEKIQKNARSKKA